MEYRRRRDHGSGCTCGCQDQANGQMENRISVIAHDISVAGSAKLTLSMDYREGTGKISKVLSDISREISNLGGIVGHIKALVTDQSRSCMLSVTDEDEATCVDCSAPKVTVELACIAISLEPEELQDIMTVCLKDYL